MILDRRKTIIAALVAAIGGSAWWVLDAYSVFSTSYFRHPSIDPTPPLVSNSRTSTIKIPVSIELSEIHRVLEAAAPKNFIGKRENPIPGPLGKSEIGWVIERELLALAGHPDGLTVSTGLTGKLSVGETLTANSDPISGFIGFIASAFEQHGEMRGNVKLASRPTMRPNWRVDPKLTGEVSIPKGGLTIGGIPVEVSGEVKSAIDKAVNDQIEELGRKAGDNIVIETIAREQWQKICRSISFTATSSSNPNMFLQLRPIRAFASHPATDEKTATVTLGLEAETRVVATDEQPNCTFPAQLEIVPPIDQGRFDITAPIDLPFKDINTLLNQQLRDRVFPEKVDALGQVTLERVHVVASGKRVLIELAVKTREEITWFGLGARATIYVWARPRLDIVAQKLRFTDLTVDVRSNAGWGLFGAAARLAVPYLKDELEKDLVIDLEPYVTSARASITGAIITFNKPETGINANATVTDFRLTDIEFDSNIVRFVAEGTGTAKIEIIKLPDLPAAADQTGSATIMPPGSPSFNCSLAASPDEIAICRSAALANLDRHLGDLFQGRLANLGSREQVGDLKEEQRNWLQQRAACRSDENCLLEKYNSRMKQLTEGQDRRTATSQPLLPTFDCSVAANSDEIAVCRNPALASLDQQLATSFQKLLATLAPSEQRRLKEEQRSWLQKRSTCSSNESCLLAAYASRISQLGSVP